MAVLWLILVGAVVAWLFGVAVLPQYSPAIHVPLVIAAVAVVALVKRRRPRVQHRA